ncbi:hypothetical protein CAI21_20945 [Alkalilimnicola ehrlichii]|uniref:DUF2946 domain-containing protein n=1 Tax=Alkalilimnicola ehrlichii TaxID=351052 RepID=A0A3E0WFM3_9GAMM|nr:DUF2946 family protein [Alkalilimnicola ehrlichii]RFA24623.1 hypothetical protein CAI21_20945 [Alkalilimnicola ehrlichii]RFA31730.1 hypothetical protein CAL65_21605 [Alkalilimnicola ehrlichii]
MRLLFLLAALTMAWMPVGHALAMAFAGSSETEHHTAHGHHGHHTAAEEHCDDAIDHDMLMQCECLLCKLLQISALHPGTVRPAAATVATAHRSQPPCIERHSTSLFERPLTRAPPALLS